MNFDLKNIEKVFFCTGARNHDLLKYFDPDKIVFEFDERMASFKALGLCRVSDKPVVVCCTSGTAVAECLPALLEAQYSLSPLILISGDRPKKMHGTGAPQTIDHEALTKTVTRFHEIGLEEFADLSLKGIKGPVHINVLVDDTKPHDKPLSKNLGLSDFKAFMKDCSAPLFLFSQEDRSMRPFIEKFKKLGIPFYAESLSGGRDLSTYDSEKTLIRLLKDNAFDSVVRIGHTPLSKVWRLLEMNHKKLFSFDSRGMAAMSYGMVAPLSSHELQDHPEFWEAVTQVKFQLPESIESTLETLLQKYPRSEMTILRELQNTLPEKSLIYLGNSLVIRFFELVQKKNFRLFGSRGVNGIDGQLATAIGLAMGTTEKVTCILGDITTLYDLSSLTSMPSNLQLVIINNSGGRIFDMLGLDRRTVMEHKRSFKTICEGFGLSYVLNEFNSEAQVLELTPDHPSTMTFLKDWNV